MKPSHRRLSLMRHAQADNPLLDQQDWDRPLTRRGQLDASEMARRLKAEKRKPDVILCSPAVRTRQTAEVLMKCFPNAQLQFVEELYLADPAQLMQAIHEYGEHAAHLLVVAHNPGITELADELSAERSIEAMPTGAIVTAEFELTSWQDLLPATGTEVEFDYPQRPA